MLRQAIHVGLGSWDRQHCKRARELYATLIDDLFMMKCRRKIRWQICLELQQVLVDAISSAVLWIAVAKQDISLRVAAPAAAGTAR